MRRKKQIVIQAELLPPAPRTPRSDLEALERLVAEKVQEILADRDDLLMQPFFASKRVMYELRRLQAIPEQRKWAFYFAEWGCLVCGEKRASYGGVGMCQACNQRTHHRLRAILGKRMRERARPRFTGDIEAIAKRALLKALPAARKETR